jgi:hypothetical protein
MKQDTILSKVIMGLIFITLLAYIGLAVFRVVNNPFRTVVVFSDVVEHSLSVNAWFFRDELRLDQAAGLVTLSVDEGEKTKSGQRVAVAYQTQSALRHQQRLSEVTTQQGQVAYAMAEDSPTGKTLEEQILKSVTALQGSASRGDFGSLARESDQLKRLVLRREYLYGSGAGEIGPAFSALRAELDSLTKEAQGEEKVVWAPTAGTFSSYVDGYESILTPAALLGDRLSGEDLTVSSFRELLNRSAEFEGGAVGKLVTGSQWFLAMVVPEEEVPKFQKSNLAVRFSALADGVPMSLYRVSYVENGEAVVVLGSQRNLKDIIALREQRCAVIFQSDQGIRIPAEALRVDGDITGVYVVTGYAAEFKPVSVLAEDRGAYIVAANPKDSNDKRILRSGDEVIIAATDLYDGKVVR